jgi:hypothetical protein
MAKASKTKPVKEQFISSFEEACAKLGQSTTIPDVSAWPERVQRHLKAFYQVEALVQANNGDWKADIADTDQLKYYPWFWVKKDAEGPFGFRLSYHGYVFDFSSSLLGARLACKSEELARFIGEARPDLYAELHA